MNQEENDLLFLYASLLLVFVQKTHWMIEFAIWH